jgi:hypothetical protein
VECIKQRGVRAHIKFNFAFTVKKGKIRKETPAKVRQSFGDPACQRQVLSIDETLRSSLVHSSFRCSTLFTILILISDYFVSLTMCAKHHDLKKHDNGKAVPVCHLCKEKYVYPEQPTPSGICHKCQTKIGVVILIIFVITGGIVFFGLI